MTDWYMPADKAGPPVTEPPYPGAVPVDKDTLIRAFIETVPAAVGQKHECCEIVNEAMARDLPGFRDIFDTVMSRSLAKEFEKDFAAFGIKVVTPEELLAFLLPKGPSELLRADGQVFKVGDRVLYAAVPFTIIAIDPDKEPTSVRVQSDTGLDFWASPEKLEAI